MTNLGKQMLEDLQRRNYAESTQASYIRHVAEFAKLFGRNPADLGAEEVKQFQLHLHLGVATLKRRTKHTESRGWPREGLLGPQS